MEHDPVPEVEALADEVQSENLSSSNSSSSGTSFDSLDEESLSDVSSMFHTVAEQKCFTATTPSPELLPRNIPQALKQNNADEWTAAIFAEVKAHIENATFSIVDCPADAKVVGSRFVFNKKYDSQGKLERCKARWVAQGFSQEEGVHFFETFAPTPNVAAFRTLLTMAVQKDLHLRQMDVHTAFLIPELPEREEIFMRIPHGCIDFLRKLGLKVKPDQVLKLNKCIYGLRQASRKWNNKIVKVLTKKLNFEQVPEEPCLFVRQTKNMELLLLWFGLMI